MEETEQPSKPLPIWASLVVIVLCLAGGGWIVRWYVMTEPLSHESRLLPGAETANVAPRARPGRENVDNQSWIRQQNPETWNAHSPEATAIFEHKANKPLVVRSLNYNNYDFVPQEQRTMIFNSRRIIRDDTMSKTLKITPDQLAKLRGLTAQINMIATPADMDSIKTLFAEYQSATDKNAAQAKLFAAMGDIARRSIEATRTAAADRSKNIKAVLSDDQWKQFESMGR